SPPLVIAHGGFSGLFPDSSEDAYILAAGVSVPNVALWCDVQLTKDKVGICFPSVDLDNATYISDIIRNKSTSYLVNGVSTRGYFSVDYNFQDISGISCPLSHWLLVHFEVISFHGF
ncbi:glycerophosphoryl diester phosphodiesterase family protein, partial [Trifolium medium]|nr:glycerophosphoryl diester phosphodiesterase family protein [Trifolium medium]